VFRANRKKGVSKTADVYIVMDKQCGYVRRVKAGVAPTITGGMFSRDRVSKISD